MCSQCIAFFIVRNNELYCSCDIKKLIELRLHPVTAPTLVTQTWKLNSNVFIRHPRTWLTKLCFHNSKWKTVTVWAHHRPAQQKLWMFSLIWSRLNDRNMLDVSGSVSLRSFRNVLWTLNLRLTSISRRRRWWPDLLTHLRSPLAAAPPTELQQETSTVNLRCFSWYQTYHVWKARSATSDNWIRTSCSYSI